MAIPLQQVLPDGAAWRGAGAAGLAAASLSLDGFCFQILNLFDVQSHVHGIRGHPWGSGSESCVLSHTLSHGQPQGKPESTEYS